MAFAVEKERKMPLKHVEADWIPYLRFLKIIFLLLAGIVVVEQQIIAPTAVALMVVTAIQK